MRVNQVFYHNQSLAPVLNSHDVIEFPAPTADIKGFQMEFLLPKGAMLPSRPSFDFDKYHEALARTWTSADRERYQRALTYFGVMRAVELMEKERRQLEEVKAFIHCFMATCLKVVNDSAIKLGYNGAEGNERGMTPLLPEEAAGGPDDVEEVKVDKVGLADVVTAKQFLERFLALEGVNYNNCLNESLLR